MVNGPSDHLVTLAAILKGESKTAFDAELEDAWINLDNMEPMALNMDHIKEALKGVTNIVFPHHDFWRFKSFG